MEEKELSALELLEEIGNNMSPEKATRAKILIPKLREKIIADGDSAAANIEGLVKRDEEIMELHRRLGDKRICDKCGAECEEHPGLDYIFCHKCSEGKMEDGTPPFAEYHWEENKSKDYMVLGFRDAPINPNDYGIIYEADMPLINHSFEFSGELQFAFDKKMKEDGTPEITARIVRLVPVDYFY